MVLDASVVSFADIPWAGQDHEALAHVTHGNGASEDRARRIKAAKLLTHAVHQMAWIYAQDYVAPVMAIDCWRLRYIEDRHSDRAVQRKAPQGRGSHYAKRPVGTPDHVTSGNCPPSMPPGVPPRRRQRTRQFDSPAICIVTTPSGGGEWAVRNETPPRLLTVWHVGRVSAPQMPSPPADIARPRRSIGSSHEVGVLTGFVNCCRSSPRSSQPSRFSRCPSTGARSLRGS
jgi:hypothetical protein